MRNKKNLRPSTTEDDRIARVLDDTFRELDESLVQENQLLLSDNKHYLSIYRNNLPQQPVDQAEVRLRLESSAQRSKID